MSDQMDTFIIPENISFRKGALKTVSVKNFMTFGAPPVADFYTLSFEPRINILAGPNGVGKSSIVCAIAIGCGAQPNFLARGRSFADFIKRGAEKAIIELTLHDASKPDGVTKFRRILRRKKPQSTEVMIDGIGQTIGAYADALYRDYRIDAENLTHILPQERVAEFARMSPSMLLTATEAALEPDVAEMHEELITRAVEWRKKEDDLKEKKKDLDSNLNRKAELFAETKKLTDRDARAEALISVRAKMLATEIVMMEEEDSRLDADITTIKNLLPTNKTSVDAIKPYFFQYCQKQPEFTAVRWDMAGECERVQGMLDEEEQLKEKWDRAEAERNNSIDDSTEIAYRTMQDTLRDDVSTLETEISSGESIDALNLERRNLREDTVKLKNVIDSKKLILDEATLDVENIQYELTLAQQSLAKLGNSHENRRKRLKELVKAGTIEADVLTAWEWIQKRCPGAILGPLFFYIWPNEPSSVKFVEHGFAAVMQSFLCDSRESFALIWEELRMGRNLNLSLIKPIRDNFPAPEFTSVERYAINRTGFQKILEQLYSTTPPVKVFLERAMSSKVILVGKTAGDKEAANLLVYWKARKMVSGPARLEFMTRESAYDYDNDGPGDHVIITPMIEPCLLTYDADAVRTEQQRVEIQDQINGIKNKLTHAEKSLKEINDVLRDLRQQLRNNENVLTDLDDRIAAVENLQEQLCTRQQELASHSLLDVKPNTEGIEAAVRTMKAVNSQRFNLLCNDTVSDKIRALTEAPAPLFDGATKCIAYLYDTSRMWNFITESDKQKQQLQDEKTECEKQRKVLETAIAERRMKLKHLVKYGFVERKKSKTEVKTLMNKLHNKSTLEALSAHGRNLWNDYKAAEKPNSETLASLSEVVLNGYDKVSREIHQMEFHLKVSRASQSSLIQQWTQKIQSSINTMNESVKHMFRELGYYGHVELSVPEDETLFEDYGIELMVQYRESDEGPVRLSRFYQSGGERVVAIAIYLLALQGCSDVPFRIVDELNQGMDLVNERRILQLVIETAGRFDAQYISASPKLVPDFEPYGGKINFIFLMRTSCGAPARRFSIAGIMEAKESMEEE